MSNTVTCIECGDELGQERAWLGYRYCTRETCQARHHRGLAVTKIGINKSGDTFIVADPDEIRRRGEGGEFGKKDSVLGLDYRTQRVTTTGPAHPGTVTRPRQSKPRRHWTAQQEKIVRLYHAMGLSPRQIA